MTKAFFRLLICIAAVLSVTAVIYIAPFDHPGFFAVLFFLFIVLIVSPLWGLRYAVFVSLLAALALSWIYRPAGLAIGDPRDIAALIGFLVTGILTSYLSSRARTEAINANQRRAEAVAAQQRFADLVDSVEGIVWDADAETFAFSFVSEQAERILGYPKTRWLNEPTFWKDHLHPEDRDWAIEFCRQATASKTSRDFEYRMVAADGRVVWMRDLVTVVVENGRATRLRGVMVDITQRKKSEAALKEQAKLLDLTHDSIFVRDMSDVITFWNRGAEEFYGWSATEALGQVSHELTKTIFPVPLKEIQAELLRTGRWEGELIHTKKNGATVSVASRWSLQRDEKGTPIAVLETNNDITERKRTEEALRRSEAYLSEAQRLTRTGSWAFETNKKTAVYWSEENYRIWGLDPQQGPPDQDKLLELLHPEDRDRLLPLRQKSDYLLEFRIVLPDGTVKYIESTGHRVFSESGELLGLVGTHVDVTERKHAEEALRRSEAYLAEAQKLTHTGSWAWDHRDQRGPYFWSDEMFRIYGIDPKEHIPIAEILEQRVHPEDLKRLYEVRRKAIQNKTDYSYEYRMMFSDGTVKFIQTIGHPIFDRNGEVLEYVGTAMDVTERKRAEEERERLRQLEAELAHINRVTTMGELTASLAHEVNQPIAAAMTNASTCMRWLAGEHPNIEEARQAAGRIVTNAKRAGEIIGRIRLLFKKGSLQHELVNLNEVVNDIVLLLRNEAARNAVSVRTELTRDIPEIMGDRVQLHQVLMNLMINGIDALKEVHGMRELIVRSQPDGSNQLLVSVRDSGIGLPPDPDQIFDAFFTTKPEGTGMGLAISRSIVESHGGRLWAVSNHDRGATFYFTLPIKTEGSL